MNDYITRSKMLKNLKMEKPSYRYANLGFTGLSLRGCRDFKKVRYEIWAIR